MKIAGVPAHLVRNVLRKCEHVDQGEIARGCKIQESHAVEVIRELLSGGYIKHDEGWSEYIHKQFNCNYASYAKTRKASTLENASAVSKMPRKRGDKIIADLLTRVREINANTDYLFRIPTLIVYGSYARSSEFISDVDIAYELQPKWERGTGEFERLSNERIRLARTNGRRFGNIVEELYWPEKEVLLHLKKRVTNLSIHPLDDFVAIAKERDSRFAYKVLLGDPTKVADQIEAGIAQNAPRQL